MTLTQMSTADLAEAIRAIASDPRNRIMSVHAMTLKHIADVIAQSAVFSVETISAVAPNFANVGCSACGEEFGPGDSGFSHCIDHFGLEPQ